MRLMLATLAMVIAAAAFASRAQAQNYPWCAQYGEDFGDVLNCGFVSFEQCMETVRGMGGFCIVNNRYEPPPGPHPARKAAKPKKHAAPKPT